MKTMKKALIFLSTICFFLLGACTKSELNDNKSLYDSEWSTSSEEEGLKFYNDDSVLYFSTYGAGSGTFEYNAKTGAIEFDGLSASFPSFISVMPGAQIQSDGTMWLYWHELGKSANYYMVLYRRR